VPVGVPALVWLSVSSLRHHFIAAVLQAAGCHHGCAQGPPIQHIHSTTIPPNTPSVRIIQGLGFTHSRTIERWPQEPLQSGFEAAVGFVPNMQQPDQPVRHAAGQLHMLDHIPGAGSVGEGGCGGRCKGEQSGQTGCFCVKAPLGRCICWITYQVRVVLVVGAGAGVVEGQDQRVWHKARG
jgi:hypothetical protein